MQDHIQSDSQFQLLAPAIVSATLVCDPPRRSGRRRPRPTAVSRARPRANSKHWYRRYLHRRPERAAGWVWVYAATPGRPEHSYRQELGTGVMKIPGHQRQRPLHGDFPDSSSIRFPTSATRSVQTLSVRDNQDVTNGNVSGQGRALIPLGSSTANTTITISAHASKGPRGGFNFTACHVPSTAARPRPA